MSANQIAVAELDGIEQRLQNIAQMLQTNRATVGDFISRVAPFLLSPEQTGVGASPAGNGSIARIQTLLNVIKEQISDLGKLQSYLGRIG